MADVLVQGMEMPRSCARCDFSDVVPGEVWCKRAKKIVPDEQATDVKRHPAFCPLHELQPHGDLIDRNAAVEESKKPTILDLTDVPLFLRDLPVIISASEEQSNAADRIRTS